MRTLNTWKQFNNMKTTIRIFIIWAMFALCFSHAGLPVIDVAAITSQRLAAEKDYLEQLLQEANQTIQIAKLVEQIKQVDSYLQRFGDPGLVKDLAGVEELLKQINAVPVIQNPVLKPDDFQSDEVFRSLDSKSAPKLSKEITVDGKVEAVRDGDIYRPEVAERRAYTGYEKVRMSVMNRRENLRQAVASNVKQLQQAGTASEVQKLTAIMSGLQTELQSVDHELEFAFNEIQARVAANMTEKEIARKAAIEQERQNLKVGTRKDAEIYQLFTEPVLFGKQP